MKDFPSSSTPLSSNAPSIPNLSRCLTYTATEGGWRVQYTNIYTYTFIQVHVFERIYICNTHIRIMAYVHVYSHSRAHSRIRTCTHSILVFEPFTERSNSRNPTLRVCTLSSVPPVCGCPMRAYSYAHVDTFAYALAKTVRRMHGNCNNPTPWLLGCSISIARQTPTQPTYFLHIYLCARVPGACVCVSPPPAPDLHHGQRLEQNVESRRCWPCVHFGATAASPPYQGTRRDIFPLCHSRPGGGG